MLSLSKFPLSLTKETCEDFCNKLWGKACDTYDPPSIELAVRITEFKEALFIFIRSELYASSIVNGAEEE